MGGILKKLYGAALLFLIVGGMAWGYLGMKGKNPVSQIMGKYAWMIYAIVGISAFIVLFTGRNAFLPFLGPTVFPCAALEDKVPADADTTVEIQVRPGAKVLYWAAEPAAESLKTLKLWKDAYAGYQNVGVATADAMGRVVIKVRKPQPYKVPMKGRLESHIHYRICMADGWMSQVETYVLFSEPFVDLKQLEAFQNAPPLPVVEPSVKPVVANTPELPVVADPVSGIPTAVPEFATVPAVPAAGPKAVPAAVPTTVPVGAETPALEGFSNETLFSPSAGAPAPLGGVESEDPRLLRLRSTVESDALKVDDSMGFFNQGKGMGTDLDAAFQPTIRPAGAPARA